MHLKTNILIEAEATSETSCLHFMIYLTTTPMPVTVEFGQNWKDFEKKLSLPN
jgi:hypothetical protein